MVPRLPLAFLHRIIAPSSCFIDRLPFYAFRCAQAIKYVFRQYSHATNKNMRNKFKEQGDLKESGEFISASDIWAFCRENELGGFISLSEIQELVRLVNAEFGENRKGGDLYSLSLVTFPEFFVQMAYRCFSRAPTDLRGQHLGTILDATFALVARAMKRRGLSTLVIEEPEVLALRGDPRTIRLYNERLREEPELEPPEGYKKYRDVEFKTYPMLGLRMAKRFPQQHLDCFEIVHELLLGVFGTSLIEPITFEIDVQKVRPKPIQTSQRLFDPNKPVGQRYQKVESDDDRPLDRSNDSSLPRRKPNRQLPLAADRLSKDPTPPRQRPRTPIWLQKMKKPRIEVVNRLAQEKEDKELEERQRQLARDIQFKERRVVTDPQCS